MIGKLEAQGVGAEGTRSSEVWAAPSESVDDKLVLYDLERNKHRDVISGFLQNVNVSEMLCNKDKTLWGIKRRLE